MRVRESQRQREREQGGECVRQTPQREKDNEREREGGGETGNVSERVRGNERERAASA